MKKSTKKRLIFSTILLIFTLVIIFIAWTMDYYKPTEEALAVLQNNRAVTIEQEQYITFTPKVPTDTGLIFYPGGKVAPEAYIPLCKSISEKGYQVVIVPMPLNLAVFGKNQAKDVKVAYPEIENWAIGGHSLGGAMAATYAYDNPSEIDALILYASYPQSSKALTESGLKVLSIWGSNDGVLDLEKIESSKEILPKDTVFKSIVGGNHAQFGNYGFQKGDHEAEISTIQQQNIKRFMN